MWRKKKFVSQIQLDFFSGFEHHKALSKKKYYKKIRIVVVGLYGCIHG